MNDQTPTPAAPVATVAFDFPTYLARQAEQEERAAALRPANKTTLFDALTAAGITHVTVTFDGEGDSGQIESVDAFQGDTPVDLPTTKIAVLRADWNSPGNVTEEMSLHAAIEHMVYDFLSDTHGGWENNDGAYGEFCFDAGARTIQLDFNERFTSSALYDHQF